MKFLPELIFGTVLLGSVNGAFGLEQIVNEKSFRQEKPHLYVNISKEHYTMEKSREEGEQDLIRLTLTDDQEEAWIFLEYFDGKEIWYENGVEIEGEKNRIHLDETPLIEIKKNKEKIKQISIYHFHPAAMDRKYDYSQTLSLDDFNGFLSMLVKISVTHNELSKYDKELANKVDYKTVVSAGTYTVKFDKKILFNDQIWSQFAKKVYDIFIARVTSVSGVNDEFDYSQPNRKNFGEVNKRFAEKFDSGLIHFSFEPKKVYFNFPDKFFP